VDDLEWIQSHAGITINRGGYQVISRLDGSSRTYFCTDRGALDFLILKLTGREADTFPLDVRGLPSISGVTIGHPLHFYSSTTKEQG
jgi:hypothetical protein